MHKNVGRESSRRSRSGKRGAALVGWLLAASLLAPDASATAPRAQLLNPPLAFETNRGQFDAPVRYAARGRDYTLFLTPDEAVLSLRDPKAEDSSRVLRSRLLGAEAKPALSAEVLQPGRSHYLSGKDPAQWRRHIEHHGRVRYHAVYPGVDLIYYGKEGQLEYDFELAAQVDPHQIRMRYEGVDGARLAGNGDLLLQLGSSALALKKPVAYQDIDGRRVPVEARFAFERRGRAVELAFALGDYDRAEPLVIDPQLVYSTYLGGSSTDEPRAIAVDSSGAAYVTGKVPGWTSATAFLQGKLGGGGGTTDAFVAKFDASGALVYSTYLGGTSTDEGYGIAVNTSGQAFVTGKTFSTDFPVQNALYGSKTTGNQFDAFVTQLSADGASLVYSTYLGSNKPDVGNAIALDAAGAIYVTGSTDGGATVKFPTTSSAYQGTHGGGTFSNVFVTKLALGGQSLAYSSLLGSTGGDIGYSIAVDAAGKAYVAGQTSSGNFPIKSAHQGTNQGFGDAFVAVLDTTKSGEASLIFSSFLGGAAADKANAIATDASGRIYVTGQTTPDGSPPIVNFPTTATALDTVIGGSNEAFVSVLSASGALVYSSYLGGSSIEGVTSGSDSGNGIAVDSSGKVYVCGNTNSTADIPVQGALPGQDHNNGDNDAFIVQLSDLTGASPAVSFGTYFGGSGSDVCKGIAVSNGQIYIAGTTSSSADFPLEAAAQAGFGGGTDGFVARIGEPIVVGPGEIKFVSATASGVEKDSGTTPVTLTVSRSGGSGAVSVSYATAPGTATADADYESKTGTLNWANGDTANKTIALNLKSDNLTEGEEAFTLALSGPTGGATLGIPATATITIQDDDIPTPGKLRFDGTLNTVAENAGVLLASVIRGSGKDGPITIDYHTEPLDPESATPGVDYTAVSGTLSWADQDQAPKTFEVPILDDTTFEGGNENFRLVLGNPTGGAEPGTPSAYTVTIVEDDPPQPGSLQFEPAIVSAEEDGGVATLTVARTGGADGSASVKYTTQAGSAAAGIDYNATAGTLSWAAGDAQPKTILVQVINDGAVEGDESFGVVLSEPASQFPGIALGAATTATVKIADDEVDDAGSVGMNVSTLEIDEAAGQAIVTVVRAGSSDGDVSVAYSTRNGEAVAGADFTATSGRLYWDAGDLTPKTIEIPIMPDTALEGGENFTVLLSSPTGGLKLLAQDRTTVVITDATVAQGGGSGGGDKDGGGGALDWRLLLVLVPLALGRRRSAALRR